jgi:hypothetical protein
MHKYIITGPNFQVKTSYKKSVSCMKYSCGHTEQTINSGLKKLIVFEAAITSLAHFLVYVSGV